MFFDIDILITLHLNIEKILLENYGFPSIRKKLAETIIQPEI